MNSRPPTTQDKGKQIARPILRPSESFTTTAEPIIITHQTPFEQQSRPTNEAIEHWFQGLNFGDKELVLEQVRLANNQPRDPSIEDSSDEDRLIDLPSETTSPTHQEFGEVPDIPYFDLDQQTDISDNQNRSL